MNLLMAQALIKMNQKSYNQVAGGFSDSRVFPWEEVEQNIKEYIKEGYKILDLGCGNGRLLKSLTKFKNISYTGLDNCSAFMNKNQEKQEKVKKDIEVNFIQDDILNLSRFRDDLFDVIFVVASFHHIPTDELRQKVMANLHRILKPQGYLIMTNWNLWPLGVKKIFWQYNREKENIEIHDIGVKELGLRDIITFWQNEHPIYYYAFKLGELKKLFKKAGFKIIKNKYVKQGKQVHWWNGWNILTVGQK